MKISVFLFNGGRSKDDSCCDSPVSRKPWDFILIWTVSESSSTSLSACSLVTRGGWRHQSDSTSEAGNVNRPLSFSLIILTLTFQVIQSDQICCTGGLKAKACCCSKSLSLTLLIHTVLLLQNNSERKQNITQSFSYTDDLA